LLDFIGPKDDLTITRVALTDFGISSILISNKDDIILTRKRDFAAGNK
jgi:hypothetical protein